MFIHINSILITSISFSPGKKELEKCKINFFQEQSGLDFAVAGRRARAYSSQLSTDMEHREIA